MYVDRLAIEDTEDGRRAEARVVFEDVDRPPFPLRFEVLGDEAGDLKASPDAFLLGAWGAALALGERRLRLEGPVCPLLVAGLDDAGRLLASWHPHLRPVDLEAEAGRAPPQPRTPARTAAFVSGGVDSLAMLRAHRECVPPDHALAVRDALYVIGLNTHDHADDVLRPERAAAYVGHVARMRRLADRLDLQLLVVRTNVRALDPDWHRYGLVAWTATMLASAVGLSSRFTDVLYASTGRGLSMRQSISHPMLSTCFDTAAVRFRVRQLYRTRFEKTRAIADWSPAHDALDVCVHHDVPEPGGVNCGRCPKCLRTMAALEALGALARFSTFPQRSLRPEDFAALRLRPIDAATYWGELVEPLRRVGRDDLADTLAGVCRRAEKRGRPRLRLPWRRERGASHDDYRSS